MVTTNFTRLECNASFQDIQAYEHYWAFDATYCFDILV